MTSLLEHVLVIIRAENCLVSSKRILFLQPPTSFSLNPIGILLFLVLRNSIVEETLKIFLLILIFYTLSSLHDEVVQDLMFLLRFATGWTLISGIKSLESCVNRRDKFSLHKLIVSSPISIEILTLVDHKLLLIVLSFSPTFSLDF